MESILERQLEEYLHPRSGRGPGIHFPRELEARFELERLERRSKQTFFVGLTGLVAYDLFLFADYAQHPSVIWRCILLRLGVFSPCILVTLVLLLRRARAVVRECLIAMDVAVAAAVVLAISYNLNRTDSMFAQTGFILVVFFGSLILHQQFAFAMGTMVLLMAEDAVFLSTDRWMSFDDKVTSCFMVGTCAVFTLIANYMMDRQERTSFAHFLKEEFHTKALSRLNLKLTALSQVDGLTGLSNRRHFEEVFSAMWQEAIEADGPLSLLMIDIDHFKRLNDTYGHIAGDRVLIQMGQILSASVRSADDLVARFGGEEFILLLAVTGHEQAHQIADELRLLVSNSAVVPNEGGSHQTITVSCGLATIIPRDSDDRLKLVGDADLALYAAKRGGRNRVACRECEALQPERRWQSETNGADGMVLGLPAVVKIPYTM